MKAKWFLIALLTPFLAACGPDQPAPDEPAADVNGAPPAALFARIEADAPYLYANLERLPADVIDTFWAQTEALYDPGEVFEHLLENDELPPLVRAIGNEIKDIGSRTGWARAGFHDNPLFAVHGISIFPALHIELADAGAFSAMLERIETNAGEPLPWRDLEGEQLIWVGLHDGLGLAIHHDRHFANFAVIPDEDTALRRVAGLDRPDPAYPAAELAALNRSLDFLAHGSGFIDWARLTERLLGGDDPLLAPIRERENFAAIAANPTCVAEYRAITRALPRIVAGYTRLDSQAAEFLFRQETSQMIGQGLAGIAETPVQLDRELTGAANLGFSANLLAARDFARSLVAGWIEQPPECPTLNWVAKGAPDWQVGLNRPIPPFITNLRGFFIEMDSLEISPDRVPTGGGALAVYMRDPQLLVGMAQMFSPAVAELELRPGGDPKPVPPGLIPQLEGLDLEAFIAMGASAIGLAVGEQNVPRLQPLLADAEGSPAIFGAKFDMALTAELMAAQFEAMMDAASEAFDEMDDPEAREEALRRFEETRNTTLEQYRRLAEIYQRAGFEIRLTPGGLEIVGGTTFRER